VICDITAKKRGERASRRVVPTMLTIRVRPNEELGLHETRLVARAGIEGIGKVKAKAT
jgi:hypothetical protein